MSERDTHFTSFAELLRRDLSEVIDEPLVNSSANFEEFNQKITHLKQIIAERAYDLVYYSQQFMPGIENIPDMTEWPE